MRPSEGQNRASDIIPSEAELQRVKMYFDKRRKLEQLLRAYEGHLSQGLSIEDPLSLFSPGTKVKKGDVIIIYQCFATDIYVSFLPVSAVIADHKKGRPRFGGNLYHATFPNYPSSRPPNWGHLLLNIDKKGFRNIVFSGQEGIEVSLASNLVKEVAESRDIPPVIVLGLAPKAEQAFKEMAQAVEFPEPDEDPVVRGNFLLYADGTYSPLFEPDKRKPAPIEFYPASHATPENIQTHYGQALSSIEY
ncbi:hypothetical protein KBD59_03210 [Candidatus Gracilibacteria bacterium]|nr:hypothetical protein [Candidatus Gracilibacteria bacterium]